MKTISAQSSAAFISSEDSSAAFFQTSGLAQAHSHQVVALQTFIFLSARDENKACESVFIAINSTPSNDH
jgi:hypothetical protein